jgi:hypothetical protein
VCVGDKYSAAGFALLLFLALPQQMPVPLSLSLPMALTLALLLLLLMLSAAADAAAAVDAVSDAVVTAVSSTDRRFQTEQNSVHYSSVTYSSLNLSRKTNLTELLFVVAQMM